MTSRVTPTAGAASHLSRRAEEPSVDSPIPSAVRAIASNGAQSSMRRRFQLPPPASRVIVKELFKEIDRQNLLNRGPIVLRFKDCYLKPAQSLVRRSQEKLSLLPGATKRIFTNQFIEGEDLLELVSHPGPIALSFRECHIPSLVDFICADTEEEREDTFQFFAALVSKLQRLQLRNTTFPFYVGVYFYAHQLDTLELDEFSSRGPIAGKWEFLDYCPKLQTLKLNNSHLDTSLNFRKAPQIEHLRFEDCTVGDLQFLNQLPNLKTLSLINCQGLTESQVRELQDRTLDSLVLTGSSVTSTLTPAMEGAD